MKQRERVLRLAALRYVEAKKALEHYSSPKSGPEFERLIKAFRTADDEFEAAAEAYQARQEELAVSDPDSIGLELLRERLMVVLALSVIDRGGDVELVGADGFVSAETLNDTKNWTLAIEPSDHDGGVVLKVRPKTP